MKYMGSKNRIAKEILPIILKDRREGQYYIEPFVGGANMIDKVIGNRIGADSNKYLIQALTTIRDNVTDIPKNNVEFTEKDYSLLRKNDNYKYKGYAGFAFSYGGKWLGGWCRDGLNKRDYVEESYKNALKQSPNLQDVEFIHSNYLYLDIPDNSIIYCDPPYKGTTEYKDKFDYETFYGWCEIMVELGHKVFISEYNMPEDFICVWSKKVNSSLTKDTGGKQAIEKLFVHKSQL